MSALQRAEKVLPRGLQEERQGLFAVSTVCVALTSVTPLSCCPCLHRGCLSGQSIDHGSLSARQLRVGCLQKFTSCRPLNLTPVRIAGRGGAGLSASRKQVDSVQKDVMQALVNAVVQIGGTAEAQAALRQHLPQQVSLGQPQ